MFDPASTTVLGGLLAFNAWAFRRFKYTSSSLDDVHSSRAAERARTVAKVASCENQSFLSDSDEMFGFGSQDDEQPSACETKGKIPEDEGQVDFLIDKSAEGEKASEADAGNERLAAAEETAGELEDKLDSLAKDIAGIKEELEGLKSAVSKRVSGEALKQRMEEVEEQVSQLGRLAARNISEIEGLRSTKAFKPEKLLITPSESVKLKRIPEELRKLKRRREALEYQLKALKYRYLKRAVSRQAFQKAWDEKQRALHAVNAHAMRLIEKRSRAGRR
jgi:archaellum component FlaC